MKVKRHNLEVRPEELLALRRLMRDVGTDNLSPPLLTLYSKVILDLACLADLDPDLEKKVQEDEKLPPSRRLLTAKDLVDPEIIVRVKRRVGPGFWSIVPTVLEDLKSVLLTAMPPKPDPIAPKKDFPHTKRARK